MTMEPTANCSQSRSIAAGVVHTYITVHLLVVERYIHVHVCNGVYYKINNVCVYSRKNDSQHIRCCVNLVELSVKKTV